MLCQIALLLLLVSSGIGYSQETAPVNWQSYSAGGQEFTVMFPKLPVVIESHCYAEDSMSYAAYADGVAYILSVNKISAGGMRNCADPAREDYDHRYKGLKKELKDAPETPISLGELNGIKLTSDDSVHLIYRVPKNKHQWYELWAVGADETNPNVKRFLGSLKIDKQVTGKNIGDGAPGVLGDVVVDPCVIPKANSAAKTAGKSDEPKPKIVLMPRATFAEEARKNNGLVGTIKVGVIFGAGGNITSITVAPGDMSRKAAAATARMVFIPANKDGRFCTSESSLEYAFY
jgi:hypothetical protein